MKHGIYDLLVTERVRRELERVDPARLTAELEGLEEADGPEYLARHLLRRVKAALEGLTGEDRLAGQAELANRLIEMLGDSGAGERVGSQPELLRALYSTPVPPARPTTPLSQSDLLMNAVGQSRLGFELEREMNLLPAVG